MLPYKRSKRVGDLLREVIADIVMTRIKDPRLGFLTVTGVDVKDDLKTARVYVSILKEEDREISLQILNAAQGFIRQEVAKEVKIKFIPTFQFVLDTSIEYGARIDTLLNQVKKTKTDTPTTDHEAT